MKASLLVRPEVNPNLPSFFSGDTVRVHFRIREGDRERVQVFQGVVIRRQNGLGPAASFTVRKVTAGIGIERTFPLHSPLLESLEVARYGSVRRAKLFYLRELQGRAARIKENVSRRTAQRVEAAATARATGPVAEAATANPEAEAAEAEEAT